MIRGEASRPTISPVTNRQLARIHVTLRTRLKLRQQDVAKMAGVGRKVVHQIESGSLDDLRVRDVRGCFDALGARIELNATYRGAGLPRMLDDLHSRVAQAVIAVLTREGWVVKVEVSFSIGREMGSIDILGWHAQELALLVVEIKSELPGVDPLLRPLDAKARLAPRIALQQFGWRSASVSRLVVLPEDRTARRLVERHSAIIRTALPVRSRQVRRWLRTPHGTLSGLWFLTIAPGENLTRNPSSVRRVRRPNPRSADIEKIFDDDAMRRFDPHKVRGRSS